MVPLSSRGADYVFYPRNFGGSFTMAFKLSWINALAFFGLFMAVVELYIPNLSRGLEQFLAWLQEKLVDSGSWLKDVPGAIHAWVMESPVGRFYSKYWIAILLVGLVPWAIFKFLGKSEDVTNAMLGFGLLPIFAAIIYRYFLNYLWYFTVILRIPCFLLERTLRFLNFIGKGKALSGIGLVMAFWGLLDPLLNG